MAITTITGGIASETIKPATRSAVYVRPTWSAQWQLMPYMWAARVTKRLAPSYSIAEIRYEFGRISQPGGLPFRNYLPQDLENWYIAVDAITNAGANTVFVGVVQANTDGLSATDSHGFPNGTQSFGAIGVGSLLDRKRVDRSYVQDGALGREIRRVFTFNERKGPGLKLAGNRSQSPTSAGVHVFDHSKETGQAIWTHRQIIDYLLYNFNLTEPIFELTGQFSLLDQFVDVLDPNNLTIWQCLNELIDRRRGLTWRTQLDRRIQTAFINIRTTVDRSVRVGSITIDPNPEQHDLDHQTLQDVHPLVHVSNVHTYDTLICRGNFCKACATFPVSDGLLTPAWDSFDEGEYNAASDEERAQDRFNRVYTTFKVPDDWLWVITDPLNASQVLPVSPGIDDLAFVDHTIDNPSYTPGKTFERFIPLQETDDDANAETEFREPFAVLRDGSGGRFYYIERGDVEGKTNLTLRPLDDELGIRVEGRSNHLIAKVDFGASATDDPPEVDYQELKFTGMVETDVPLEARVVIASNAVNGTAKEIRVDMPDVEYWFILEGTITDIDDGAAVLSDTNDVTIVRDDSERLRAMLARMEAWYGIPRIVLTVSIDGVALFLEPGELIGNIPTNGYPFTSVGTIVTEKVIEFRSEKKMPRTTISTGFSELDFNAYARREPKAHAPLPEVVPLPEMLR